MAHSAYTFAHLDSANWKLVQAARRVDSQRFILRGLLAGGHDTAQAEVVLAMLEDSLDDQRALRDAICEGLQSARVEVTKLPSTGSGRPEDHL